MMFHRFAFIVAGLVVGCTGTTGKTRGIDARVVDAGVVDSFFADAGAFDAAPFDAGPGIDTGTRPDTGPRPDSSVPVTSGRALFVGGQSTCVLRSGTPYCFGDNEYGNLGQGRTADPASAQAMLVSDLVQFDLGRWTSCGVDADGAVWCSGQGGDHQTGLTLPSDRTTPRRVEGLPAMRSVHVADRATCGVTTDNRVICWGRNHEDIFAGELEHDEVASGFVELTAVPDVQTLSAGEYHLCAITLDNQLLCWGTNTMGQIGDGTTAVRIEPYRVLENVIDVALSHAHTCAATTTGAVYCWGSDWGGQAGRSSGTAADSCDGSVCVRTPNRVASVEGATQVAAGDGRSCARLSTGRVRCWGSDVGSPSSLEALEDVRDVATGGRSFHMCARLGAATDNLWCWGRNDQGQVGNGTMNTAANPVRVTVL